MLKSSGNGFQPFDADPFSGFRLLNSIIYRLNLARMARDFTCSLKAKESGRVLRELIRDIKPAVVWGLAHYDYVPALLYALSDTKVRFHLSIHDEPISYAKRVGCWPNFGSSLVSKTWPKLLRRADSIDVISPWMLQHLAEIYGIDAEVVMPPIRLPLSTEAVPTLTDVLRIGLSGWASSINVAALVGALQFVASEGLVREVEVHWVGAPQTRIVTPKNVRLIRYPWLATEVDVVNVFSDCHLLYLSFPFESGFEIFRKTSFPSKLPTYLASCRTILVHAPHDSTPIKFSTAYGFGLAWTDLSPSSFLNLMIEYKNRTPDTSSLRELYSTVATSVLSEGKYKAVMARLLLPNSDDSGILVSV